MLRPTDQLAPDTADDSQASRRRLSRWQVIALAGTVIATGVLIAVLAANWDRVGRAVALISVGTFVSLTALQILAYILRTQAFSILIQAAGARTPAEPLHGASAATFLANGLVPTYIGVWVRVAMLRRLAPEEGPTIGQIVTADGVSLFLEGIITVFLLLLASTQLRIAWWWITLLVVVCGLGALAVWQARRRLAHRQWVRALAVFDSRWKVVGLTAILVLVLAIQPVRFYMVLHAVGLDVSAVQAALAFVLTSTGAILPIGPGAASVGGTAAVLGHQGLAEAAASGVVLATSAVVAGVIYLLVALAALGRQRRRAAMAEQAA